MMRKHAYKLALTLTMLLAYSLLSCDNRYNTSTLIINQIIDPIGSNPVVYVALSRSPDFLGGTKTYTATYDLANPGTPAVVFESISWENKNEGEAGEFWLLVAEDDELGPNPGIIGNDDNVLPAMRIVLEDGQTTTIERIIFDSTAGPPAPRVNAVNFSHLNRSFRIFVEDPALVSMANKMYLRLGIANDFSIPANVTHDIPIADPNLLSGLSLRTASNFGFVWIDASGDGLLNFGDGDWISTSLLNPPTNAPALADFNPIVLWSGQTY
jgi:hypothetical protein